MPGMSVDEEEDYSELLEALDTGAGAQQTPAPSSAPDDPPPEDDVGDDLADFLGATGIQSEREVPDIRKPWMKHHEFVLVQTVAEVEAIVDQAIAHGRVSLDLETQGLDSRIYDDADGNPQTVHQIVGFCLSVDGHTGYYVPVRHKPQDGGPDLNVPLEGATAAIKRLCLAAQPKGMPEAVEKDPLSFREFAEEPQVIIYFWNAQFDQEFLYPITGIDWWHPDSFEDGMLACYAIYAADKGIGLKPKSKQLLRDPDGNPYEMIELKELFPNGRKIQYDNLAPDEPGCVRYACSDGICTYLLCELETVVPLAREKHGITYRLEKQVSQAVRTMERPRVKVKHEAIQEMLAEHIAERDTIFKAIQKFAASKGWHNLEPASPKQLSEFLFGDGPECLNITPKPPLNEASGQYKTDADTFEEMVATNPHAPPILKQIVEFRAVEKVLSTYLGSMAANQDKNNELRFSFKQTGAGTGRFSAPAGKPEHGFSGVPVHGIPGDSALRRVFIARDGYSMAKCDYAAQELRIAANVSGEKVWIDEFLHGDGDLHRITAAAFFNKPRPKITKEERSMGKTANFALIYGGGPAAIIRATGCDKLEASRRKKAFDKAVNQFAAWVKKQHQEVKDNLGVRTALGRWLAIPDAAVKTGDIMHGRELDAKDANKIRASCERHSTNYPIQGCGADIMKISMVLLCREFYKRGWLKSGGDDSVRLLLTVHDEVVFEIRHDRVTEAIPIIVDIMESPDKMARPAWKVPLIVEPLISDSWGGGYDAVRMVQGMAPGDGEVVVNGFLYKRVRKAEKDVAGDGEEEFTVDGTRMIRMSDPPWLRGVTPDDPDALPPEVKEMGVKPGAAEMVQPTAYTKPKPKPKVEAKANDTKLVTIRINRLNRQTVKQVKQACVAAWDREAGKVLRLVDAQGATLIDPSMGILINPEELSSALFGLNLSEGRYVEE